MKILFVPVLFCLVVISGVSRAQEDTRPLSAEEAQARWHSRLDGRSFSAHLQMKVDFGGFIEIRRLTVNRDDTGRDAERVMIRFDAPPALQKMGLLYFEHPDRPNDYFLYRPSVRRIRRLPESAVRDNLYGIDPEFLGFGIAHSIPTRIQSLSTEMLGEHPTYRLVEVASSKNRRFDKRIVWLDAKTFIPLRTEHERNGKTVMIADTLRVRRIHGVETPVHMRFLRPVENTSVEIEVARIHYDQTIPRKVFSIFRLTRSRLNPDRAR